MTLHTATPVDGARMREVLGHFASGVVVVTAAAGGGASDTAAGGGSSDTAAGGGSSDTAAGGGSSDTAAGGGASDTAGPDGPLGFTCQSFASLSLDPPLISLAPARTSSTWPRIREVGAFCVNVLADDHEQHSVRFARSGIDRFAGVSWTPGPGGAPILDGVAAWVVATLEREYDGGDHTIAVGRVHALGADPARAPLLFHRGRYGRLRAG